MSAIIKTNSITNNQGTRKNEEITIVVPLVNEIYDIVYQESDGTFNTVVQGDAIVEDNSWFKKNKINPDREHPSENTMSVKLCPFFKYETTNGKIKTLTFDNLEIAKTVKKELENSLENFYSNYTDYVKTIK